MKIFYSRSNKNVPAGYTFQNARFFDATGVQDGVTSVHLDGHYPLIAAAYKAAKVEVIQGGPDAARKVEAKVAAKAEAKKD